VKTFTQEQYREMAGLNVPQNKGRTARKRKPAPSTQISDAVFAFYGLPAPTREHRFYPGRKWRIDFAFIDVKLAIEIEGGSHIGGRHVRPYGFSADMEKYNALNAMGWQLLRYEPKKINYEQIAAVYRGLFNK
jgi:hypothetical protein